MLRGTCHCGAAGWTFEGEIASVTACNCSLCRRYGALWAYGHEGVQAAFSGITGHYRRLDAERPSLDIHFCQGCCGVVGYRSLAVEAGGLRKIAVNIRLAPPEAVLDLAVEHFDGLESFDDLPSDGRRVRDLWF